MKNVVNFYVKTTLKTLALMKLVFRPSQYRRTTKLSKTVREVRVILYVQYGPYFHNVVELFSRV